MIDQCYAIRIIPTPLTNRTLKVLFVTGSARRGVPLNVVQPRSCFPTAVYAFGTATLILRAATCFSVPIGTQSGRNHASMNACKVVQVMGNEIKWMLKCNFSDDFVKWLQPRDIEVGPPCNVAAFIFKFFFYISRPLNLFRNIPFDSKFIPLKMY